MNHETQQYRYNVLDRVYVYKIFIRDANLMYKNISQNWN